MAPWSIPAYLALTVLLLEVALVLRRGADRYRGYLALLVGDLALVAWVVHGERFTRDSGGPTVELIGSTLACVLLVLVPSLLDRLARRAIGRERFDLAARWASLKELLVPGKASAAEHEFYAQIARARAGRIDEVIRDLRTRLVDAEPPEDELIQERIVTMLVFARRWREAAMQFENHIGDPIGRFPGLAVQMVRVYGELGDLDRAAQVVERLESAAGGLEPGLEAVLLQARLQLLAYAGAANAVERLLGLAPLERMSPRMHSFFRGVARARAGLDGGDPAVTPLPEGSLPEPLARFLEGVAERAAIDVRAVAAAAASPWPPVTVALIVANLIGFALFALLLGDSDSVDNLVRGGASFHPAVRAGEWWRLWIAMFLHGGWMHIVFNLYGLYLLGRLVEPILGGPRFLVIYCVAGLVGNLLSVFNPNPQAVFSIGASGAVLGIMGALMVALLLRRGAWPESWRRNLLWNLGVLLLIQIYLGWVMPITDNYAHVGGLIGGALATVALMPGRPSRRRFGARSALTATALLALAVSAGWSLVSLARERPAETMARLPRARMDVGPISIEAPLGSERVPAKPADWPGEEILVDRAGGVQVAPHLTPLPRAPGAAGPATLDELLRGCMERDVEAIERESRVRGPSATLEAASAPPVDGWSAAAQARPGHEGTLYLYYARPEGAGQALVLELNYEGDLAHTAVAADEIRRLLGSVRIAQPTTN